MKQVIVAGVLLSALVYLLRKECTEMDVIYVAALLSGAKTWKQVPALIKPRVKSLLIALDLEDLIQE